MAASGTESDEYPVEEWLSSHDAVAYRDYWEDEEEERRKPYWVLDGDFSRLESYLADGGRVRQIEQVVSAARTELGISLRGRGCDLGTGVTWAVPHLLRLGDIERIWCVEYSRNRLLRIGPAILRHYAVPADRVVLALGNFNELKLPDTSLDFVFMCAAFHHTDDPAGLLAEIRRVLKPSGVVLIIGEHIRELTLRRYAKHAAAWAAARALPKNMQMRLLGRTVHPRRRPWPSREELLAADQELGDHYYLLAEYRDLFAAGGFGSVHLVDRPTSEQSFVLVPQA